MVIAQRRHPGILVTLLVFGLFALISATTSNPRPGQRPNILWIVSEDNNPYLGCYGDPLARTPTLDRLAKEGALYELAFSQAPVCAPSRFTLITGIFASSCGPAEHMRAQGKIPPEIRGFPAYLRGAGYYCTNNAKTDYNAPINIEDTWDESSKKAHWRKRPAGTPFFSVFNFEVTHESQVFPEEYAKYPALDSPTDPARVKLPSYHPETPELRLDRAHYYDQMARLDQQVANLLSQLKEDGLLDETIIFYYGDNGGVFPRSKRFCYDSGLHVPLLIRFPEKYRHLTPTPPGSRISSLVSFVDFAPTVLSLAGVQPPAYFQGQAFCGPTKGDPPKYVFGFRNRIDERYDMVRTVRTERYRYIRNYMPHLPGGQHLQYMWRQRGVAVWEQLYHEGKLNATQRAFWEEKPSEELYDLPNDPEETHSLTSSPAHRTILQELRLALDQHILAIHDNGFMPESSLLEGYLNSRDPRKYPLERILPAANLIIERNPANLPKLINWMKDENECLRYWAAMGCVMLREKASPARGMLSQLLKDESAPVRVMAAEALCYSGQELEVVEMLAELLKHANPWVRLQAANALQNIGVRAKPVLPAIEQACSDPSEPVRWALLDTASQLKGEKHIPAK
jgi:arylsulfatase A-like enzyme